MLPDAHLTADCRVCVCAQFIQSFVT